MSVSYTATMEHLRRVVALLSLGALLGASAPLHYPTPPKDPVVDDYFGTKISDAYRPLEDAASPATRAWASAESALARRFIHGVPAYASLHERVATLVQSGTVRFGLQIRGNHDVYLRRSPSAPQAALVTRAGINGAERVLFDPSAHATQGVVPAIESVYLSNDGMRVAFTTQLGGSEDETLHVVDVRSGAMLADTLPHVGGGTTPVALAWDADGKGFTHTQLRRNADGTYAKSGIVLVHHALGTDPATDAYVFGRGLSPKAEYALLASLDGRALAAIETDGDGVPASLYVRRDGGTFTRVATPAAGIGSSGNPTAAFVGDTLVVVAKGRHSRGEVIGIGRGQTVASGRVLVAAGRLVIDDVAPAAGGFVTFDDDGGDGGMRLFTAGGTHRATLPIPAISTVDAFGADPRGGEIIVGYENYTHARAWYHYDVAANALRPTNVAERTPAGFAHIPVRRALVPSLDGTVRVPVEVIGTPRGRTTPTILIAYGMYGIVSRPRFTPELLAWLERGGVFAQAMVRGGGEYGEEWHQAARHATKTRSADDLAAAGVWLGTHGYGDAHHLGIIGGSAGGFLMGLALTRDPQRYRAVLGAVGIYDLLRIELTPNGAFNTPEFGTVKDPAQFRWMLQQSPYHHVRRGVAYPAVLLTTGENDPRVDPWNSRKMVAALQADSSSPYPVLLLQKSGQGHGIGNSLQQRIEDASERYAFFASQLGAGAISH